MELENVLPFWPAVDHRTNLILFVRALSIAINKLNRQKVSCSANLDSLEIICEHLDNRAGETAVGGRIFGVVRGRPWRAITQPVTDGLDAILSECCESRCQGISTHRR